MKLLCFCNQEQLAERGDISLEEAEKAMNRALESEEQLDRAYDTKIKGEASVIRRVMAARKDERMNKMKQIQAAEKAEVCT